MFELQLVRIKKEMPMLFSLIDMAIKSTFRRIDDGTKQIRNDPLVGNKTGYFFYILVEHAIRRTVEEANIPGVDIRVVSNGGGTLHLEIHTPYGIITFARVHHEGDVPRKAKFRQVYIDQTFVQEVYPELKLYTPDCKPLYVVTYSGQISNSESVAIRIGRLTVDQENWSCNYTLGDLISTNDTTEEIEPKNEMVPHENVQRISKIRIKR